MSDSMFDKSQFLFLYVITGILLALWPIIVTYRPALLNWPSSRNGQQQLVTNTLLGLGACAIGGSILSKFSTAPLFSIFPLALFFTAIAASARRGRQDWFAIAGIMAGLIVTLTLPWWLPEYPKKYIPSWFFVRLAFLMIVSAGFIRLYKPDSVPTEQAALTVAGFPVANFLQYAVFICAAAILSFQTNMFLAPNILGTAWHHWSAYIGPSELLIAGARIFYDFPAQYGFGPTILIAALCGKSCWPGMYAIVSLSTLAFAAIVASIALSNQNQSLVQRGLILVLCLVCCFFWAAYPAYVMTPTTYPSTNGLRFLPVLVLVFLLIRMDRKDSGDGFPFIVGHLAWSMAAIWSPESTFFATFVWWPVCLLLRCANPTSKDVLVIRLLRAMGELLGWALLTLIVFLGGYWLAYGSLPDAHAYFLYALNPPGVMSINSKGAIWFFLTAITLGIFSNWLEFKRTGNGVAFRRAYVLTLLAFATFSYFLGRSHENNILNLSPYILLVLLSIRTEQMPKILRSIPAAMLAGLIGWCGFFVWNAWVAVYGASSSLMLGHEYILPAFTDEATALRQYGTSPHNRFSVNVSRAIVDIKSRYGEPVTVIRNLSKSNLTAWESDAVWSAIHGPDLFESVPSASRRVFLARTAKTLNRNGWLIIEKGYDAKEWILDFESVYTRKEEFDLGNYLAIRYVPGKR